MNDHENHDQTGRFIGVAKKSNLVNRNKLEKQVECLEWPENSKSRYSRIFESKCRFLKIRVKFTQKCTLENHHFDENLILTQNF